MPPAEIGHTIAPPSAYLELLNHSGTYLAARQYFRTSVFSSSQGVQRRVSESQEVLSEPLRSLIMITDVQLGVFCNILGVSLMLLVVLYHYVVATSAPKPRTDKTE
ncbi:hypothetical protein RvY_13233 [Ramazzottius varieornatus]|uniref:Dolichyl-diphosphooligosaccharide--protein glycosyltransferase subunit 4 n=1 Tax=Ramazzottius varieornatus TaxID=947166 RepID=A0A1D1VM62_RAMVA|nr:hypothetical protein RvY_13233 [Ramazzottius varieornatus]